MNANSTTTERKTVHTFDSISKRKSAPIIGFVLLIVLFLAVTVLLPFTSRSEEMVMVFDTPVPIRMFTGVLGSLGNFLLIFLTVFYKKPGFIVSIIFMSVTYPLSVQNMLVSRNVGNIPGVITGLFTIMVIILLYLKDVRNDKFQERLRVQAITDRLTGLPNRFACSELMNQLIEKGEKFAVVSIDLNNFKSINDTMGQATGDAVLIEIATRLQSAADAGTSKSLDFVAHQGGDEFAIVIREYKTDDDIVNAIEYYRMVLEEKMTVDDCDYVVTACFGYAEYPADADNGDSLFTCAVAAMHEAKRHQGESRVLRYRPDLIGVEHDFEIEKMIRAALDGDGLYYYLQPQFDTSKKLRGFEALARMNDADGNMISPADFIPVAEKVGLVDKIDARVLANAAMFLGELIKKYGTDVTLSANVSVRHLMKNDFIEEVHGILDSSGVPANQIEIEITESIMVDSIDKALECINELKSMGIKVAIDDFGTGYSSLSYLNSFPADLLKVDKSFIDDMNASSSSKQYVAAIISIGHLMNLDVIAEGVEDSEQLETLRSIDCDFIQGFYWGRPMPPKEAEELVMRSA